jgi:hypothetical protein
VTTFFVSERRERPRVLSLPPIPNRRERELVLLSSTP